MAQQKPPDILDDDNNTGAPPNIMDDTPEMPVGDTYTGPDSFMEGVLNSGPEVLGAMGKSALGYLKGATLDIPSTIYNAGKSAISDPLGALKNIALSSLGPLGDVISGRDTMAPLREASANAGAEPEAFGRILGQMAGQPAVTAGVSASVGPATRALGTPVAAAGRIMKNYQPISGVLPSAIEPRLLRIAESMAGRGIEKIGNRMKGTPAPIEGEVMPDMTPDILEGDYTSVPPPAQPMQTGLPPSRTSFYGPEANPVPPMELPAGVPEQLALPPSNVHYSGPSSIQAPTAIEDSMPPQRALPSSTRQYAEPSPLGENYETFGPSPAGMRIGRPTEPPKVRVNSEGNFVDLNSGQTFDHTGKVMSYPSRLSEVLQKPFHEMTFEELQFLSKQNLDKNVSSVVKKEIAKRGSVPDRNSPFFRKNRNY